MAKINILPSKVYNRIAAGEVVERPCSVVKELVENSIDAGATEIEIHIEQGGKQLIRVIDNGCGIEREDMQSAFLPHATSKIATAEDLDEIMTLGFRGEAIASISAVSKMSITSKTENGKCYKLSCNGGELGQIVETQGSNGTEVCVEMLFYHTPVRLGFLKSDKAEEAEITNFVSRFILNRSDIAFTYYANGKKILQSFGTGDEEAMLSVYGASVLSECYRIDALKHGVRIRGYIGNANYYKATKSYQSVFLNGRYITNATISAAIGNAYASYLMKRQYPFYVLHIDVPTEIVDVNVHPNKADVRFADNQIIYGCIYSVISAILDGQSKGMEYVVTAPTSGIYGATAVFDEPTTKELRIETEENGVPSLNYEQAKAEIEKSAPAFTAKKKGIELPFEENIKEELSDIEDEEGPAENPKRQYIPGFVPHDQIGPYVPGGRLKFEKIISGQQDEEDLRARFPDLYAEPVVFIAGNEPKDQVEEDTFSANKRFLDEIDKKSRQNHIEVFSCKYAGKLFNTYILYELDDCVYIIDQHAAHERLIFDRLKEKMASRSVISQPMLVPYVYFTNYFEATFLREQMPALEEMGFVIKEPVENRFEVLEVPVELSEIDLNKFINDILAEINEYRAIKLENILKDKLASSACKAAVKGGMDLTNEEIEQLFKMMDGNMSLKCPHGRPVVVQMTKKQLEKMFKRIV